jgi:RNA polymerase sigma-70 factor, ECF subfamily
VSAEQRIRALLDAGDLRGAATLGMQSIGPRVLRYLRSILWDETAADEAFSAFSEALWRGLESFRGDSSFSTWALRLATNTAHDYRDDAWRRRARPFATGEASALAAEIRTQSRSRARDEERRLEVLRHELSPADQMMLALRVDQKLSWAEVAAVLNGTSARATEAALSKRFERLRRRLARLARDRGLLD